MPEDTIQNPPVQGGQTGNTVTQKEDGTFVVNTDVKLPDTPPDAGKGGQDTPPNTGAAAAPDLNGGQQPNAGAGAGDGQPKQDGEPAKKPEITGGFKPKAKPQAPETPEWFKKFQEETKMKFESPEAMMAKLNAKPEVKEVNNELGDDYIKNAVAYYKEHGTLQPYLDAFSVKFEDMTPEQLMRHELAREYPNLSSAAFDALYKERVSDKYRLDPENDEGTIAIGKELLSQDAEKLRGKFIEEQKGFIPPKKEDVQAKIEAQQNQWRESIEQNPTTASFMDTPQLEIAVDGESFVYDVENPKDIVDMAVDNRNFWKLFADEQGGLDMQAFIEVAAFAKNREQYKNALIGLGRSLGVGDSESTLKHSEMPKQVVQRPEQHTDWRDGFLNAALNQKKV